MSIATDLQKLETDITNAYSAVQTKGGTIPSDKNTNNLATAINSISGGGGKPEQSKTATPSTSSQTILPDTGYTLSSVTVNAVTSSIDSDIKAENIKEGVEILGVTGTVEPKIIEQNPNYVMFINYDGTVLYSYTKQEVQALTELPPLPVESGYTFSWNWTLEQLKASGRQVVGVVRETVDGSSQFKIALLPGDILEIPFKFQLAYGTITINWGDGNSENYTNDTSTYQNFEIQHTYSNYGKYTISMLTDGNAYYKFPANVFSTSVFIQTKIIDICLGDRITDITNNSFQGHTKLKALSIPNSFPTSGSQVFRSSEIPILVLPKNLRVGRGAKIKNVSFPGGLTGISGETASDGSSFTYFCIPHTVTSIGAYAARSMGIVGTIIIPKSVTTIGAYAITGTIENIDLSMYDDANNLPSLGSTAGLAANNFLVKNQTMLNAFENATNWSSYAGKYEIGGEYAD